MYGIRKTLRKLQQFDLVGYGRPNVASHLFLYTMIRFEMCAQTPDVLTDKVRCFMYHIDKLLE